VCQCAPLIAHEDIECGELREASKRRRKEKNSEAQGKNVINLSGERGREEGGAQSSTNPFSSCLVFCEQPAVVQKKKTLKG
jgi:hypothetical protein